jgi:hypothetical protein
MIDYQNQNLRCAIACKAGICRACPCRDVASMKDFGRYMDDGRSTRRQIMKDVDEQFKHPTPVKHSDNEKSKMPQRSEGQSKPAKKSGEDEPPVE